MKKKKFIITGMTCSACSSHVEKAVAKLGGIARVSVNLLTNTMIAEYDPALLDADGIIECVVRSGYGASLAEGAMQQKAAAKTDNKRHSADKDMLIRLIVSLVFMVILMYVAMGHMFGAPLPSFLTGSANAVSYALLQLLLCVPIIYVNRAYFINGFKRLFGLAPNMDTLIAVGSSASLIYGIFAIFRMSYGLGAGDTALVESYMHDLYFESAGMILALVTVGKYLETLSKKRTGEALNKLRKLVPDKALLLKDGEEISVDSASLAAGDMIAVKAGMAAPADCTVTEGHAFFDESAISGESVPVEKTEDSRIIGGTVNRSGYVAARVTAVGGESVLSGIIRLVEEAGASKAPIAKLADRIAGIFVPVVMTISAAVLIGWLAGGYPFEHALSCAIAVLVISCPCALGLATPVAIMVGTGKGAEYGILIKSGDALETLHSLRYVVLDKTGTITEGVPEVSDVICAGDGRELIAAAAGIESKSEHPLAEAVSAYAKAHGITPKDATDFKTLPGKGVTAVVDGCEYAIGNTLLMREVGADEREYAADCDRITAEGKTPLLAAKDGRYIGLIAASDRIKPTSRAAVEQLKKMGIKTVMLTGDNRRTADAIAREVGVDEVFAEVLPGDKEQTVSELMRTGTVAMVGDGINDAPALTRADVGIAIGSGSDIAVDSADIVLIKDDLSDVVTAIRLSRRTITNIKENLFWAFFYNTLGIPLAAGVLFVSFGIKLDPMIGAAAMSLSSLFVVLNALRLKFVKPAKLGGECAGGVCAIYGKTDGKDAAGSVNNGSDGTNNDAAENAEENNVKRSSDMKNYTVFIDGMMCGHCTARVEKALRAVQGVISVSVSLDDKRAVVETADTVTADALKAAVEAQDYTVTEVR